MGKTIMENQLEIWKSHPDIPGIEVSTLGRVRTLDRLVSSEERTQFTKGRILKQYTRKDGYLHVSIKVGGKWTFKKVHRLVAQTFLPNPHGFPMVNHKDCNRKNNNVSNIEWCDNSYNMKYREEFGEASGMPVFAINLNTLEVSRFSSQKEASLELGISQGNISNVIKGRYKQIRGFWFVNDDGHAADVVKSKLHDIGGTGLKIKCRATSKDVLEFEHAEL